MKTSLISVLSVFGCDVAAASVVLQFKIKEKSKTNRSWKSLRPKLDYKFL